MATRCLRSRRATIEPVKPNAMNGRAVFTPPVSLIAPARSARRNPSGWLAVGSLVLVVSAVTAGPVRTRSAAAVEITVARRASSNASIAASGSLVGVTWAARTPDGVTDIYATTSNDGGRTFRAPVRVNRVAGDAAVSGEQPPLIALTARKPSRPAVTVMWTAKAPAGTRVVTARSSDGGRSFGPAESVPGSDADGNRGWESMAVSPAGDVLGVWLDHREVPARTTSGAAMSAPHQHGAATHESPMDGAARAQFSQIFFARLSEPASARAITHGVCYCCKTALAQVTTGPCTRRGAMCMPATCATSHSRCHVMAAEPSSRRFESVTTTGCSMGAPKMARR